MTADDLQPGTIPHAAVRRLRLLAPNEELSTAELAEAVGQSSTVLIPAMQTARNHGIVSARKRCGGNGLWWSMGSGKAPQTPSDDDDELVQKPTAAEPPPITSRSVFDIARGAPGANQCEGGVESRHAAEGKADREEPASTPKGSSRDGLRPARESGMPATSQSPSSDPVGHRVAHPTVIAGVAPGPSHPVRFALWSDGALEIRRVGADTVLIDPADTQRLFDYLDVLRAKEVSA